MKKIYNYTGNKLIHIKDINNIIDSLGTTENYNYVELFLGSGVVFLNLKKWC
jgi:site-specific DNA-adenine methylase